MAEVIRYLYGKNLAILRWGESDDPGSDIIYYFYKEFTEKEIENWLGIDLLENGKSIIKISNLLEEVKKQNKKIIDEVELNYDEYLLYNLFGYLLFIKMALKELQNIVYSRGFTKIAYIIAKDEENIAHEFSQYLLREHNYDKGLEQDILNIVNDKNKFIECYKPIKEKLKGKIDKIDIEEAYDDLRKVFYENN